MVGAKAALASPRYDYGTPKVDTTHHLRENASEGIHSRVYRKDGDQGADTGCTRASQSLMLEAQAQLAKKEGKTGELDKSVAGKTLDDLYPPHKDSPYQKYEGNKDGLNPDKFVPGDRVHMPNHKFDDARDGAGDQGSNVIYVGKTSFGEPEYVHMDGGDIVNMYQLQDEVRRYTKDEERRDKVEKYRFTSRYSPVPGSW
jgi:hypothetical protein